MPAITSLEVDETSVDPILVWTQVQTVATCVGLVAILLTVGTLVHSRYLRLKDNDPGKDAANADIMGIFATKKPSYIPVLLGAKVVAPSVPSIRGLITAGDVGLWTSGVFGHVHTRRGDPTATGWVSLVETALCGMSRFEDSALCEIGVPTDVLACIQKARQQYGRSHPSVSMYDTKPRQLVRCIRRIDTEAHSATLPCSTKERLAVCRTERPWLLHGNLCLSVSASETMALATILGIPLEVNDYTQTIKGVGAFGFSLEIGRQSPPPKIELSFSPYWSEPVQSCSSGYTTVMAKSIAFGCVLFSQNEFWVNGIYVNQGVLDAIKTGRAVADNSGYGGASMQYLWQLPAAKAPSTYFYPQPHWAQDGSRIGAVESMKGDQIFVLSSYGPAGAESHPEPATWQRAVSGIPVGGLVPQCCSLVADAVTFTVGGKNIEGCINEIEELINDLYTLHTGTDEEKLVIFGTFVQERCRAKSWIETDNWTRPVRLSTPWSAITFRRYMCLLEIIAARFESEDDDNRMELLFRKLLSHVDMVFKAAVKVHLKESPTAGAPIWAVTDEERRALELDLGDALASTRKKLRRGEPLSLEDAALIVRGILAAWAIQVPVIRWRDEMLETDLGPLAMIPPPPRARRLAVVGDLPQVAGLS